MVKNREKTFGSSLYSMFIKNILIPTVLVAVVFMFYSNRMFTDRESKGVQNILNSASQNITLQFSDIQEIERAFYIYKEVFYEAEALNNRKLYENYDELTRMELENDYTMTLTKIIHTSEQNIRSVVFFPVSDGDTAFFLGKAEANLEKIEYKDYHAETWYEDAVENQDRVVFYKVHDPNYEDHEGIENVYSYIRAIRSMDSKKIIGVVKIDVSSEMLLKTLEMVEEGNESRIVILKNNKIFAQSGEEQDEIVKIRNEKLRLGDKLFFVQKQQIGNTELELAYLDSRESLYRGYMYIIIFAVIVMSAASVLAFINYRRQAGKMVRDINAITEVLKHVERGELDSYIVLDNESEFKKISDAINQMVDNLKKYIEREYLMEIQQQKAEYRALQSQINPHFLYNTLNGFVALNRMGEKKILERSIIGLSKLFRYACSDREVVTISEELQFLEEFLKLEKLKYQDRLEYILWGDEESRTKKIPRLLLQPLVENSIKHGMGNEDEHIMIRVMTRAEYIKGIGKVTVLTVRDNGVGCDVGKMQGDEHIGMSNVKTRAELFCKETIFQFKSNPGYGTTTTIVFLNEEQERKDENINSR